MKTNQKKDASFVCPTCLSKRSGNNFASGIELKLIVLARKMKALSLLLLFTALFRAFASSNDAYPTGYGDEPGICLGPSDKLQQREGEIFDITHPYTPNTPVGDSDEGAGHILSLLMSMKNGSDYNLSEMRLCVHAGTHVDAPGHMYDNYFDQGFDVDTLDLRVLNGPVLVVDVPRDKNITAEVMKSLNVPKGVKRVLFRTLNTDRRLMWKKEFDSSYVGFMKDGAQWLVDNTDIKLVGIDYLSVAAADDVISAHLAFLKSREIILVEGLKLDEISLGIYTIHCLPLRLVGSDGSPIRCILIK